MSQHRRIIRGSLALFGAALGLIITAGGASAAEETGDPQVTASAQAVEDDASIGDALLIERPATRRAPGSELPATSAPVVRAPAPEAAPARSASVAPAAVAAPVDVVSAPVVPAPAVAPAVAAASRTSTPSRPTQVLGVQLSREAEGDVVALARTGVDTFDLTLVALALLGLGIVLIRRTAPSHR